MRNSVGKITKIVGNSEIFLQKKGLDLNFMGRKEIITLLITSHIQK